MFDYWKVLVGVAVLIAGYQWYGKLHVTARLLKPDAGFYAIKDQAAWSQHGQSLADGADDFHDSKSIHASCLRTVSAAGNDGSPLASAQRYLVCYTGTMQRNPERLCDINARKNLLWHLKHYTAALKFASYKTGAGPRPPAEAGGFGATFAAVNAELHNAGTTQAGDGAAELPHMDASIVHALNTFVRHGLVSPEKDLSPVIDTSVLNENPTPAEFFTARKETCK